jgi:hypothetical protein
LILLDRQDWTYRDRLHQHQLLSFRTQFAMVHKSSYRNCYMLMHRYMHILDWILVIYSLLRRNFLFFMLWIRTSALYGGAPCWQQFLLAREGSTIQWQQWPLV